jgi:adenylosuccinate synthase
VGDWLSRRGVTVAGVDEVADEYMGYADKLRRYVGDASRLVYDEVKRGRHVLFEGAQGALLDVDHGTYPFVTSSSTLAAGACTSAGIGPTAITSVIGIAKAYTTRVGGGPFPTELTDALGDRLREAGGEYGATTGRPRRCGWLDVAALRLAVRWNGLSGLALTKLDVLRGMGALKICVGYTVDGEAYDELPTDPGEIDRAIPVYEELEGWDADTREVRDFGELPPAAQKYVRRIEALVGVDCALISVGPGRAETIVIRNPFR